MEVADGTRARDVAQAQTVALAHLKSLVRRGMSATFVEYVRSLGTAISYDEVLGDLRRRFRSAERDAMILAVLDFGRFSTAAAQALTEEPSIRPNIYAQVDRIVLGRLMRSAPFVQHGLDEDRLAALNARALDAAAAEGPAAAAAEGPAAAAAEGPAAAAAKGPAAGSAAE